MKSPREFGSWTSPIGAEMMASNSLGLSDPRRYKKDIYWLESRPNEQGRCVIVRRNANGLEEDLIPAPYSARSSVHEYGGRCYCLGQDKLFFVNASDQQIYHLPLFTAGEPKLLTPQDQRRYADLEWNPKTRSVMAVCEDHRVDGEPVTSIVDIPLPGKAEPPEPRSLVSGADFYAYPRLSCDGSQLCWIQWNHPDMPWFATQLWLAEFIDQELHNPVKVSGDTEQAVFQPEWHPDGSLYYCSDIDNLWNLYRHNANGNRQISRFAGECGLPLWQFGMQTYAFLDEETAVCALCTKGIWELQKLNLKDGRSEPIDVDLSSVLHISGGEREVLVLAANPTSAAKIYRFGAEELEAQEIKASSKLPIPENSISLGRAVEFSTTDAMSAHGFFYAPFNPDYCGLDGTKPPLIVLCHGGPTAATTTAMNLKVQFWTSRGFAVFDINYRGSTGYGREYRSLLDSKWGIYDVEDACAAAQYAAEAGWVDPDKCIIRGSSAGGFTVLSALAFHDTFSAAGCLYGIADLRVLAGETHKFEARYADSLIAPLPEGAAEYDRRSPIHYIDQISCPVIFFQGLKDKVVPPNQAQMMVDALQQKGLPIAYVTYPDEGHGFRSAGALTHSFNAELAFYGKIFDFDTDSTITDLTIANCK